MGFIQDCKEKKASVGVDKVADEAAESKLFSWKYVRVDEGIFSDSVEINLIGIPIEEGASLTIKGPCVNYRYPALEKPLSPWAFCKKYNDTTSRLIPHRVLKAAVNKEVFY